MKLSQRRTPGSKRSVRAQRPTIVKQWSYLPRVETLEERCLLAANSLAAPAGDPILEWNAVAIAVDQTSYSGFGSNDQNGPTASSRALAIESAAMYDAWNSINARYTPYLTMAPNAAGASDEAAVATAAHDTIAALYPHQQAFVDAALVKSLDSVPDGDSKTRGIAVGQYVAQQILQARTDDGSQIQGVYTPDGKPGHHQPDPLNPNQGYLGVSWGQVTPFAIPSTASIPVPPVPALTSLDYTQGFNQVKSLGSNDSTTRTQDQTELAIFWGYDASRGLGDPPRLYNQIARVIAAQENNTVGENARMFALINLAMADAAIVAWGVKFRDDAWRPIVGIRQADTDGNPDTTADPTWSPLGAPKTNPLPGQTNFTPPFPGYISGHATIGGAMFKVLADFYQTDDVNFSIPFSFISDEFNGVSQDVHDSIPGLIQDHIRQEQTRIYTSFSQAAAENAASRIFLGIHFRFDAVDGIDAGDRIGDYTYDNLLRPRMVGGATHVPTSNFANQIDAYLNGSYTTYFTANSNPGALSPAEKFLNQTYLDLLGRRYDNAGHAYWMSQMQQGMSENDVMHAIQGSLEFQTHQIDQAYLEMLGRNADSAGLASWSVMLADGGTMDDVLAGIAASPEFTNSPGFLDKLYKQAFNRGVDDAARAYWNSQLAAGVAPASVAHAVFSSDEFVNEEVAAFYQNYLDRSADPVGQAYWSNMLKNGGESAVRLGMLGSAEHASHVNPI